jgi:uncharacterized protein (UPF0333 family)
MDNEIPYILFCNSKMTNENSSYIQFFPVNCTGIQTENITRPVKDTSRSFMTGLTFLSSPEV